MRISDWSSDVCSSDLVVERHRRSFVANALNRADLVASAHASDEPSVRARSFPKNAKSLRSGKWLGQNPSDRLGPSRHGPHQRSPRSWLPKLPVFAGGSGVKVSTAGRRRPASAVWTAGWRAPCVQRKSADIRWGLVEGD